MEQTNKMQCAPSYVLLTVFETTTCTRVNVTSVSVKQPFIWWRHSIDFQSFQNPNLFKHQTLREKQTACTKLSGDQSICLLCAFFHLKGGCGGILPNFWAAFTWARGCAWAKQWHEDVRYCNHQWLFNPVQPLLAPCTS